jgi:hypothetical protein
VEIFVYVDKYLEAYFKLYLPKRKILLCLSWIRLSTLCAPIIFENTRCLSWNLLWRWNNVLSQWKIFQAFMYTNSTILIMQAWGGYFQVIDCHLDKYI